MRKTKVLYISQEITPYLPENDMSVLSRYLPQGIQEKGREIRTFMPKFGCINERRNQLHEVIRLSGMNLIIDGTDHPLIIKVASIQAARMQVYFIDNEDYFQRKFILKDDQQNYFADNEERMIFFAKGVLETVKKLRWSPDIIHCQGWFTSVVPLYIKKAYNENPLFAQSKVIYSLYNKDEFSTVFDKSIRKKIKMEGIADKDLKLLEPANYENITKLAIHYSDGVVFSGEALNDSIRAFVESDKKPFLNHQSENSIDVYSDFYDRILSQK